MKIKSLNISRALSTVTFTGLGDVEFDENCMAEVADEKAQGVDLEAYGLINLDKVPTDGNEGSKGTEGGDGNEGTGDQDPKKVLSKMKITDLKNVATQMELPAAEWENLSKSALVDYLVEKQNG